MTPRAHTRAGRTRALPALTFLAATALIFGYWLPPLALFFYLFFRRPAS